MEQTFFISFWNFAFFFWLCFGCFAEVNIALCASVLLLYTRISMLSLLWHLERKRWIEAENYIVNQSDSAVVGNNRCAEPSAWCGTWTGKTTTKISWSNFILFICKTYVISSYNKGNRDNGLVMSAPCSKASHTAHSHHIWGSLNLDTPHYTFRPIDCLVAIWVIVIIFIIIDIWSIHSVNLYSTCSNLSTQKCFQAQFSVNGTIINTRVNIRWSTTLYNYSE